MQPGAQAVPVAGHDVVTLFIAELICPDPECAEPFEGRAPTLEELEALACDCGCALRVTRVGEALDDTDETLLLIAVS